MSLEFKIVLALFCAATLWVLLSCREHNFNYCPRCLMLWNKKGFRWRAKHEKQDRIAICPECTKRLRRSPWMIFPTLRK